MSANTAGLSWRRSVTPVIVVAMVLMAGPTRAAAQAPSGQKPPAAAPSQAKAGPTFTFQGFGSIGYVALAANQTFDAVLGSSGGLVFGGGATVTHRRGYFGRVSIEHFSGDGERVFVFGGDVYPLGIPLSVSMTPIDITGGYRFLPRPKTAKPVAPAPPRPAFQPARPGAPASAPSAQAPTSPAPSPAARPAAAPTRRWVPYVGGGVGFLAYKETSDFAEPGDDVDDTFTTYNVLGGVDVRLSKWMGAGAEIGWRFVPNALEDSDLGQQFGEDDLGGLTIRALITVGR